MKIQALLLSLILFLVMGPTALAENRATDTSAVRARRIERVKERLSESKLKACQAKEKALQKRVGQLTKLVTDMEEKFASIAKRVQDYYKNKVEPSGKTVANYEALVSEIAAKKAAVDTALAVAKTDSTFSCTTEDPKGALTQFRLDMQAVKAALKNYRTAIKNLIVAVHSVAPTPTASPSPSPTQTP